MTEYPKRFDGRTALVTGAGSGIGRACALRLAAEGAWVALLDRDGDAAAECAREIAAAGCAAEPFDCDVADSPRIAAVLARIGVLRGELHLVVNSAGVGASGKRLEETDDAAWQRTIDVNLSGTFRCMRESHGLLKASGGGAIVNIASMLGVVGFPMEGAYVAAKHGVIGLTRSAALSWGGDNIRVTAVCPTFVRTRMTAGTDEGQWRDLAARHPLGRLPSAEEVAALVAYLGSDEARTVTGTAHLIDSGFTAS